MAKGDAEVLQILIGELRQDGGRDIVVQERLLVAFRVVARAATPRCPRRFPHTAIGSARYFYRGSGWRASPIIQADRSGRLRPRQACQGLKRMPG